MSARLLFALRLMLGAIWLYNGLWLKIVAVSPEHLAIVSGLRADPLIEPHMLLTLIGVGETLLAFGVWSGVYYRFVAWFQLAVLLAMNSVAIVFSGAIQEPIQLLFQNLPLLFCMLIAALYGPGSPQRNVGEAQ